MLVGKLLSYWEGNFFRGYVKLLVRVPDCNPQCPFFCVARSLTVFLVLEVHDRSGAKAGRSPQSIPYHQLHRSTAQLKPLNKDRLQSTWVEMSPLRTWSLCVKQSIPWAVAMHLLLPWQPSSWEWIERLPLHPQCCRRSPWVPAARCRKGCQPKRSCQPQGKVQIQPEETFQPRKSSWANPPQTICPWLSSSQLIFDVTHLLKSILDITHCLAQLIHLARFHWRRAHHAKLCGQETFNGLWLTNLSTIHLQQRNLSQRHIQQTLGFHIIKLWTFDGAEVTRNSKTEGQPGIFIRHLGCRKDDTCILCKAADVEVGQLVGWHHGCSVAGTKHVRMRSMRTGLTWAKMATEFDLSHKIHLWTLQRFRHI